MLTATAIPRLLKDPVGNWDSSFTNSRDRPHFLAQPPTVKDRASFPRRARPVLGRQATAEARDSARESAAALAMSAGLTADRTFSRS